MRPETLGFVILGLEPVSKDMGLGPETTRVGVTDLDLGYQKYPFTGSRSVETNAHDPTFDLAVQPRVLRRETDRGSLERQRV